jgi:alpha-ketoglutaric semialdehyde dehydrogenase
VAPLLLLVDLQRDYLTNPELEPAAGRIVRQARALLDGCRELGVPVAHVWTTVSRRDDRRMSHWKREGRWLCEEGTPGHEPPRALEPRDGERIVHKAAFSAFAGGTLDRVLDDGGIDLVVVAGVHLHGCVRQAVLEAYERSGVEVWVAEDATASDDPVHAAITRRYLERRAVRFLSVEWALDGLGSAAGAAASSGAAGDAAGAAAGRCRTAQEVWSRTKPEARAGLLGRLADRLEPEAEAIASEMAARIGKPVRYGSAEVWRAARMLRAIADHAVAAPAAEATGTAEVRRRPLGVVAVITPWNNPVYIPLGKIGPALAFGNAVVWKPAPAALAISERVAELLVEVGLPPGGIELVAGGRRAGEAAMADPRVDGVTVTGSSLTGFAAQEACARRRVPLQAELGGNNGAVVWPDADLGHAAREITEGAFALAGQRCTANRRVIVHRACAARLLELLERETAALEWGDPHRPETQVGPLLDHAERDRVADVIARAVRSNGPPIVPHGDGQPAARDARELAWYPPTIVSCEDPSDELVQHETFGPVLVVQEAGDWEHAMALLNGVRQGLVAALFSASHDLADRFLREAAAGILKLNRSTADAEVDVPFGGWKWSGIGPPEHGGFDREFYTRPQTVYRWPASAAR